jgi:hypothetical protein
MPQFTLEIYMLSSSPPSSSSQITDSMKLSSWEAASRSATQEFPNIHTLVPILSQINPVQTTLLYFVRDENVQSIPAQRVILIILSYKF